MSFSKRPGKNTPQCYTKPLDPLKNWNNRFFWVDECVFPTAVEWRTNTSKDRMPTSGTYSVDAVRVLDTHRTPIQKQPEALLCLNNRFFWVDECVFPTAVEWRTNASKDGMPTSGTYSVDAVRVLDTHRTPIQKQPEALLCLVGISRRYYLGDDVYPTFHYDDDREMDLFSLIRAPNPTKVKTGSRLRAPHELPLLTLTTSRVIKMDEPTVATDSSGVPSAIEKSPLDFADEAEASSRETAAPEMPPPEGDPRSGVGDKNLEVLLETEAGMKRAAEGKNAELVRELEDIRAQRLPMLCQQGLLRLSIPVYPEVRDPQNPWACKEEIALADAIAANISRAEKKKKCRIVCRTHGVGSAHHARSNGVPVSVPVVVPQGLAVLLVDGAT
nr:transposase (putative), gypsy type [Tanacetum cinerariifolium]